MNIYFTTSKDPASINHPELGSYRKVKAGPKDSIYVTDTWSDGLTAIFGEKKIPDFSIGDDFVVDGSKIKIEHIKPIFIDSSWTFKYIFENGSYRIEDQLPKNSKNDLTA